MGEPKSETATIRIASTLLLLAISLLALVGCLGQQEDEQGGEEEEKGGGETTSSAAGGETTGTGEETTTAALAATTLELTQSRETGVVGNANITDTPGGVEVAVAVEGLLTAPGTQHVAHIHEGGTCADDRADNGAPVQYPLDPLIALEDGTASSATSIEGATLDQLTSGAPKYVNVHAEPTGEGVPPGIACADLPGTGGEVAWVDEEPPAGASLRAEGDEWSWVSADPTPFSGTQAHQSNAAEGLHYHLFEGATDTLSVDPGDWLFAYVYLDPQNIPEEVMLEWNDDTGWEHRAYWGANNIEFGTNGTESRRYMGPLPPAGVWVRLEVAASQVGLEDREVNGMAYTLFGGRATWDLAGKASYAAAMAEAEPGGAVSQEQEAVPAPLVPDSPGEQAESVPAEGVPVEGVPVESVAAESATELP